MDPSAVGVDAAAVDVFGVILKADEEDAVAVVDTAGLPKVILDAEDDDDEWAPENNVDVGVGEVTVVGVVGNVVFFAAGVAWLGIRLVVGVVVLDEAVAVVLMSNRTPLDWEVDVDGMVVEECDNPMVLVGGAVAAGLEVWLVLSVAIGWFHLGPPTWYFPT